MYKKQASVFPDALIYLLSLQHIMRSILFLNRMIYHFSFLNKCFGHHHFLHYSDYYYDIHFVVFPKNLQHFHQTRMVLDIRPELWHKEEDFNIPSGGGCWGWENDIIELVTCKICVQNFIHPNWYGILLHGQIQSLLYKSLLWHIFWQ